MKNSKPSSEFEHKDRCPSCGSPCNIHTDLDANDNCNECRNQIDTLEMGQIIPKEEPKTFKELFANTGIKPTTNENGNIQYNFKATMKKEPKQETLEEAAIYNYKELYEGEPLTQDVPIDAFKQGANWQAERMYSEEEMISFMQFIISQETLDNTSSVSKETAKYYLEQFKNK